MSEVDFWENLAPLERDIGQRALGPLLILSLKTTFDNIHNDPHLQTDITDKACVGSPKWGWSRAGTSLALMGVSVAETVPLQMSGNFFSAVQRDWLGRNNTSWGSKLDEFEKRQLVSAISTPPFMMEFIDYIEQSAPRTQKRLPGILSYLSGELAKEVERPWLAKLITKASFAPSGFWGIRDDVYLPDAANNVRMAAVQAAKRDSWPMTCWKPIEPNEQDGGFQLTRPALDYQKLILDRTNILKRHKGLLTESTKHYYRTTIGCPVGTKSVPIEMAEEAYTPEQLNNLTESGILTEKKDRFNVAYDPFKAVCETSAFLIRSAALQRN